jgi:hypothetical protein
VLSFEGSQSWMRDSVNHTTMRTPRFLFLWTLVQPAKPAPQPEQKAEASAETKPTKSE